MAANASMSAVLASTIELPLGAGGSSFRPPYAARPLIDWISRSWPGRSTYGPSGPKPDPVMYTSEGFAARRSS